MGKNINSILAINIGDCLRKIRMSHGDNITQRDVAEGAVISTRYYAYLELGQKVPSFEVIMKIARAYKMPLSEFVKHFENQL
jgi:transcriptional regulator with XRE-family HTH domain